MPHLRTDAGLDLELDRDDDGTARLAITGITGERLEATDVVGVVFTAAEARMIGAFLNPVPAPVDGAELRARAAAPARARTYDPGATLPRNWSELVTYATHQAGKGLEVVIRTPVAIPDLVELAGVAGVTVIDDDEHVIPPGDFEVGRNGQRIARYHLGAKAADPAGRR